MIPRGQQPPYCKEHQKEQQKKFNRNYDKKRDPKITAFYKSRQWERFRRTVLAEYHYLCQYKDCNNTANIVHHIVEVKEDWSKRFERSNCIPVCHSCHEKIHGNRFSKRKPLGTEAGNQA